MYQKFGKNQTNVQKPLAARPTALKLKPVQQPHPVFSLSQGMVPLGGGMYGQAAPGTVMLAPQGLQAGTPFMIPMQPQPMQPQPMYQ